MITFLKKYANDSFEKLVNEIHWMDLPFRLKAIFSKLPTGGGVQSISGDFVDNTDPLNPILNDTRPYKVYTALLKQTGTNAPVATVLENTLGTINYNRTNTGRYTVLSPDNLFTVGKTTIIMGNMMGTNTNVPNPFTAANATAGSININSSLSTTFLDSLFINTLIEIRVYN